MGEGFKIMQEDLVCHYFIDLDRTRVGGACGGWGIRLRREWKSMVIKIDK
jgi:hypothetical protein